MRPLPGDAGGGEGAAAPGPALSATSRSPLATAAPSRRTPRQPSLRRMPASLRRLVVRRRGSAFIGWTQGRPRGTSARPQPGCVPCGRDRGCRNPLCRTTVARGSGSRPRTTAGTQDSRIAAGSRGPRRARAEERAGRGRIRASPSRYWRSGPHRQGHSSLPREGRVPRRSTCRRQVRGVARPSSGRPRAPRARPDREVRAGRERGGQPGSASPTRAIRGGRDPARRRELEHASGRLGHGRCSRPRAGRCGSALR